KYRIKTVSAAIPETFPGTFTGQKTESYKLRDIPENFRQAFEFDNAIAVQIKKAFRLDGKLTRRQGPIFGKPIFYRLLGNRTKIGDRLSSFGKTQFPGRPKLSESSCEMLEASLKIVSEYLLCLDFMRFNHMHCS